jgi:hypothetical protein
VSSWKSVRAREIAKAGGRCQCTGQCGVEHDTHPQDVVVAEDGSAEQIEHWCDCVAPGDTLDVFAWDKAWFVACRSCRLRMDAPLRVSRAQYTRLERARQTAFPFAESEAWAKHRHRREQPEAPAAAPEPVVEAAPAPKKKRAATRPRAKALKPNATLVEVFAPAPVSEWTPEAFEAAATVAGATDEAFEPELDDEPLWVCIHCGVVLETQEKLFEHQDICPAVLAESDVVPEPVADPASTPEAVDEPVTLSPRLAENHGDYHSVCQRCRKPWTDCSCKVTQLVPSPTLH